MVTGGEKEEASTISIESEHIASNGTETISSSQLEVALKGPKTLQKVKNEDEEKEQDVKEEVKEQGKKSVEDG